MQRFLCVPKTATIHASRNGAHFKLNADWERCDCRFGPKADFAHIMVLTHVENAVNLSVIQDASEKHSQSAVNQQQSQHQIDYAAMPAKN